MSRQEANRKIVEELSKAIEKYPDLRFHQLLYNMDVQVPVPILNEHGHQEGMYFKDLHSEESSKTLERMLKDY
jgi:hypothetical protein